MSWNHRVMRHRGKGSARSDWFAIHEVYYNDAGKIKACTKEPVAPGGETIKELRKELARFTEALSQPVLEYDEIGKEKK